MRRWGKIFSLPPLPTLLVVISAAALLAYAMAGREGTPVAYAAYLYSTYALIVGVSGARRAVKWLLPRLRERAAASRWMARLRRNPQLRRYLSDPLFRAEVSLYVSLALNLLYVFLRLFFGLYYRSAWMITLGVYYLLLVTLRFSLVSYLRRNDVKTDLAAEYRRYRLCGILLLVMNLALSGIAVLIVVDEHGYDYPGSLIYAMALYAFYFIIAAFRNVFKYRRHGSPILSAAKVVSLTTALVSILSLETAMLDRFGGDQSAFRRLVTGVTGAVICAAVLGMAAYMIRHANRELARQKNGAS